MNRKAGFTLIELIVVVAIIGVLISVTVIFLGDAKKRSADTSRISAMAQVKNALSIYFNDSSVDGGKGNYPAGDTTALNILKPKFISAIDSNIRYQSLNMTNTAVCASNCQSYILYTVLAGSDNKVLNADKDLNTLSGFNGAHTNCSDSTGVETCYDVTP